MRLRDDQLERLNRAARQFGRSPSQAAALLVEESLREREFAFIEFRDSPVGRQAYLQGTRLAVWQVVWLVRHFGGDAAQAAASLDVPPVQVVAAIRYAQAYPREIEVALQDSARGPDDISRLVPGLEVIVVDTAAP